MKHKFQFDKQTGTMVPANDAIAQGINSRIHEDVQITQSDETTIKPAFKEKKRIVSEAKSTSSNSNQVVKMQRTDKVTPVQLVNEIGLPESYLDCISNSILMFRERQDYDICQITDEKTGKVLAYIGGYGLAFTFNMAELRTMERIEQCLQGLVKLFRHKIMAQNLNKNQDD